MSTATQSVPEHSVGWFARAEAWMDDKGKGAWIVAMVLAFIFAWPIGLALLAYMIWNKKMNCSTSPRAFNGSRNRPHFHASQATGNAAFDAYKAETLRRLEEEQENFQAFLQRLRDSRDKAEFDEFMEERAKNAASAETND